MSISRGALSRAKGAIGGASGALGGAFVVADVYSRTKNGQSMATAVPTALVTNAVWSALPGGYIGAAALMGAQMAPMIADSLHQATGTLNQGKKMFNGYYQENDAQLSGLSRGMDRMQQARGVRSAQIMQHAKGKVQAY